MTATAPTQGPETYRWSFYRAGGLDQARIDAPEDMLALETLDQKLWVALSCPTKGVEFDERTLALLDSDKDGRVRAPEILGAIRWLKKVLKDPAGLAAGEDGVPLAAIDAASAEGKRVLGAARHILEGLGKPGAERITIEDTQQTALVFKQARFNGDGVLPPESVDDADAKAVALEIIATEGGVPDRSGLPGITQAKVDQFWSDLAAFEAWWARTESDAKTVLPLGPDTPNAYEAFAAVRAKIEDFFGRCRVAAYDPRALLAVNREENAYLALAAKDMTITADEVAGFPISKIEPGKPLPLSGTAVNPAWAARLESFRAAVVAPLAGDGATLAEAKWTELAARLDAYRAWHGAKAGAAVESLGIARIRAILAGGAKETLTALIARDKAVEPEILAIEDVERLARYWRDLHRLLNNFVSFTDFYSRRRKAIFQAGTLYLDGRACELVVRVDDAAKHGTMAGLAKTYLAYCDCTRKATNEKITIAAAFTAGDSDYLMVGRNGLFYDRRGNDWDATITKIVENPISIGQAFWAPYKRVLRWIEEQIAKRAAAADTAATDRLTGAATSAGEAITTGPAAAKKPTFDVGVVAALGVAVGGITAALGALLEAFFGLGIWMPLGLVALVLLISGPSMVIAWLKLRQRNLGPILDANGWALNGRVKVNIPFGAALTSVAALPAGARRSLTDPYAPKKRPGRAIAIVLGVVAFLLVALWYSGQLERIVDHFKGAKEKKALATPGAAAAGAGGGTVTPTAAPR